MTESQTSSPSVLTPVLHTLAALIVFMGVRISLMPEWSPSEESAPGLLLFILWMMSVLPVLYLAFRRWAENTIASFYPQIVVFITLSFGIQTALKAVSLALLVADIPSELLMPFVWALPWLAMVTFYKNSYATAKQCYRLLVALVPTVLLVQLLYLLLPAYVLLYSNLTYSIASLFGVVVFLYAICAWRLNKSLTSA